MKRRHFLRTTTATCLAAPFATRAAEAKPQLPIIDTHTHFYDPRRPEGVPWPRAHEKLLYRPVLPAEFIKLSARHGVLGTVVIEASPRLEDNQWNLDLAAENPVIVGYVGNLGVGQDGFAGNLKRFAANPIFRGIRLSAGSLAKGLPQETFAKDLQLLADSGLSLDLLGGPAMLPDAVRLAKLVPTLRIVIDHLPFKEWDADPAEVGRALAPAADCSNLFAKVSNITRRVDGKLEEDPAYYRPRLDALWESFGPDRVIFGSNWPVSDMVAPYEKVHQITADYVRTKDTEPVAKFHWRNSLAFYRWQPRGAAAGLIE